MKIYNIKKKTPEDYYKQRMIARMAGGWRVVEDTKWYTDIRRNKTSFAKHFLLTLVCLATGAGVFYAYQDYMYTMVIFPTVFNWAYYRLEREDERILKSIRQ